MRALIAFLLLPATLAAAAPATLDTKVISTATEGIAQTSPTRTAADTVSGFATTVTAKSPGILQDRLVLSSAVTSQKNDYSSTLLLDRGGNATPLSQYFDAVETSIDAGAEFSSGAHNANLHYARMASASPFAFYSVSAGYNFSLFSGTTTIGANFFTTRQDQPHTYFVDPRDFHVGERPRSLTSQKIEFFAEQVLTARWKILARIFQGDRFEDRPRHYGGELRNSYALGDRWFARLDTGILSEDRRQNLKDEHGYYTVFWNEWQLGFEPVYDFLITAAYGVTVEREDVAWQQMEHQVGSDNFSLRASYRGLTWNIALAATETLTNTSYRAHTLQGQFTWEI